MISGCFYNNYIYNTFQYLPVLCMHTAAKYMCTMNIIYIIFPEFSLHPVLLTYTYTTYSTFLCYLYTYMCIYILLAARLMHSLQQSIYLVWLPEMTRVTILCRSYDVLEKIKNFLQKW